MSASLAGRLSALFWDVDGTLAETEGDGHLPAFNHAFGALGEPYRWDDAIYGRLLAVSGGRERLRCWFLEQEGSEPAPERLDALVRIKQRHYGTLVASGAVPLRPGVERLIREAAAAGLSQAIVTTSGRAAVQALVSGALAPVADCFRFWICGEDVAAKKPDPEGFRLALSRLALDPSAVLVLEDSGNGLAAATAAGLACVVTRSGFSRLEDPAAFGSALVVLDDLESGGPQPVTLDWLRRLMPA